MLPLLLAVTLGQVPASQPLTLWHTKCQFGHEINVRGYEEGGKFHAIFPITRPAPQGGPVANYGIKIENLPHSTKGHPWYGGNVDWKPAVGASGEKPNRVHVTFVGSQVEREAARKDMERDPEYQRIAAEMGDGLAVQDYGPENPLVKDVGLVDGGKPDVVIQTTKGGKVTFRAHNYPGADVMTNEIRRANPAYDPARDPGEGFKLDLSKFTALLGSPVEIGVVAVVLVVLAGLAAKGKV